MGIASKIDDEMEDLSEINLTPFIDVILVLLIIFMVAAQTSAVSQDVDLPSSQATPLERSNPVTVTVAADGGLTLAGKSIPKAGLRDALAAEHAAPEDRILLLGDQTLSYQSLMAAFDALRAAGYSHIGLVGKGAQPSR